MDKAPVIIGVVFGVLVYAGFMGGIIYLSVRWSRSMLKRKSDALLSGMPGAKQLGETQKPTLYRGAETEYEVNGRRVLVNTYYQNRSWVRATLRIPGGPYPYLMVFPEGKVERFGKAIGLNREVQTGDQAFDDLAYLDTWDSDENVRKAVEPAAVRGAISDLLQLGYKVQLSAKGAEAFQLVYGLDKLDGSKAGEAVAALGRLADALPSFDGLQLATPRPAKQVAFGLTLVFSWIVGFVIAGACSVAVERTVDEGLVGLTFVLGGGLVWLLYTAGLVAVVRGRSYAMRTVLVGSFIALFGIPAGGGALLLQLNQTLDSSPATARSCSVLSHKKQSRGGCRLALDGWAGAEHVRVKLHHKGGDEVLPAGSAVTVRTHPGAFGAEWYEPISADGR